jgi:excisionase family DNA binding protein
MAFIEGFDTVEEHAERYDRSPRTIYRWLHQPNGLPHTRHGSLYLLKPEWTREWLEQGKTQNNPIPPQRRGRGRQPERRRSGRSP